MGNDMEIKDEKSYIFDKTMKCNVCKDVYKRQSVVIKIIRYGKFALNRLVIYN